MRISIRREAGWPPSSADLVHRHVDFALGRVAARIRSLTVHLRDLNGPRGGMDKQCVMMVRLDRPRRAIVIEDVDSDASTVVSRAAGRAARAVVRAIQTDADWRARALRP